MNTRVEPRPLTRCPIALLMLVAAAGLPVARAGATFYAVGDLTGGTFYSVCTGVSADGSTVTGTSVAAAGLEAFTWKVGIGLVSLGDLPGGAHSSNGLATNADGTVVVGYSESGNGREAFRWDATGGMVGLGDLPGSTFLSEAWGVNGDGTVVVGRSRSSASGGNYEAFRWTLATGMIGLGDLAGSSFASYATGVSADGSVVVGLGQATLGSLAFRWTQATGMVGLDDLAGGGVNGVANAISTDGSVIVGWSWSSSASQEAFRHTAATGAVGLGLVSGGFSSSAYAVNGDGSLIVGDASPNNAAVWNAAQGMRHLKDVLMVDYGLAIAGWTLNRATGVSADGRMIAGYGLNPSNQNEGWVVVFDPVCPTGANAIYGSGKPGTAGLPLLQATSLPVMGMDSPVQLVNALPGALPYLVLGTAPAALPFDGGSLLVSPLLVLPVPVPVAPDGTLTLHGVLPNDPALCGFHLYHQALFADPGAAGFLHLALTNGLQRTIGGP